MEFPDVEVFRAWLEAHAQEGVGVPFSARSCPLARFLSETSSQACWVAAGRYGVPCESWSDGRSSPAWAEWFEGAFDEEFGYVGMDGEQVTGSQALTVLDEVV